MDSWFARARGRLRAADFGLMGFAKRPAFRLAPAGTGRQQLESGRLRAGRLRGQTEPLGARYF